MAITMPVIDWAKLAADHPTGIENALIEDLQDLNEKIEKYFGKLAAVRLARAHAAELFETSDKPEDVNARKAREVGNARIAELDEKIAELEAQKTIIQNDLDVMVGKRVELLVSGDTAEPMVMGLNTQRYEKSVAQFLTFTKGKKAIFPELATLNFPGSIEVITGQGALRTTTGDRHLSTTVVYEGKEYTSISQAANAAKVSDNSQITRQVLKAIEPLDILPVGESVTVTISDNGVDKVFVVTGKKALPRGRKALTEEQKAAKKAEAIAAVKASHADDSDPTEEELAAIELAAAQAEDADDDDDDSDDSGDDDFTDE